MEVTIRDPFWTRYQSLVREVAVPYQWEVINDRRPDTEPSHAIRNFRIAAGLETGDYYGYVFQDSDVAKWLETVAYSLTVRPDPALERTADEVIELIARAQQPDGYLNTYFTVKEPGRRWTNLHEGHELYCAGHFIEAAVAYAQATGKTRLLEITRRFADLIDRTFGPEPRKLKGYCGHPEIELALVKLFEQTGEKRYLELARYFVEQRGQEPYYFALEYEKRGRTHILPEFRGFDRKYLQAHVPVRQQSSAEGHAVRVTYLYSAVADIARLSRDPSLRAVCDRIWDSITTKRMYVTGGIGSTSVGESFTLDYDLPNDTAYAETCASVGMVLFAHRMLKLETNRRYADVMEVELYNGVLSGISLDGTRYFYVNPLSVWPEACRGNPGLKHVKAQRQGWYACACCPPNLARLLSSLGSYVYSEAEGGIAVHLYVSGDARLVVAGDEVIISQETGYPYDGKVRLVVRESGGREFPLRLRIPGWAQDYSCAVNGEAWAARKLDKGYLELRRQWSAGDVVELSFDMPVRLLYSHPRVRQNSGKVAIQRGPLVYCLEEEDNGPDLHDLRLAREPQWALSVEPELLGGTVVVKGNGWRTRDGGAEDGLLYSFREPHKMPVTIRAVPYSLWCNRRPGEMTVWIGAE